MSGFDETTVPSTHYQSVSGELIPIPAFIPSTQEVVPMDEITQNPFPVRKETEPMKFTIKDNHGALYEYDLSILAKPFDEMSNMDLVLAWIKAHQMKNLFDKTLNVLYNDDEYGTIDFVPNWKPAIQVDDNVLDAKLLVDKFFKKDFQNSSTWENENYSPAYMYSYRILQPKIKKHGRKEGQGSVEIVEFLVSDLGGKSEDENKKHRLLIEFNTYAANTSGSHYQKKWPYAMMITRTKDGLRIMWVRVRGEKGHKFIFGATYSKMENKGLVPSVGRYASQNPIPTAIIEYLQNTTKFSDWMPIAKYITPPKDDIVNEGMLHPFEIDMSMLYWIGGSTDVKAIVNKAYGKSGVAGVTKHMFGGRNNIDSIEKLRIAIWWARALRDFPSTVFNSIDLNMFVGEPVKYYSEAEIQKFFKIFGTKQSYIDALLLRVQCAPDVAFSTIGHAQDTVRMMKLITRRQHRTAIINHVKNNSMTIEEIHDFVNIEYSKIRQENKELKKNDFHKKFLKHQETWINDDIQVIVPTQTHDLVEWGATQNNCIGSYGEIVFRGDAMIIGFKDRESNWIGHAEITSSMELRQLLGKHNVALEQEHRESIVEFLKNELNINVPSYYWGAN